MSLCASYFQEDINMVVRDMIDNYQVFALGVQEKLAAKPQWQERYASYASTLLADANRDKVKKATKAFRIPEPLFPYITIGKVMESGKAVNFDLRYLGQSVGTIKVEDRKVTLHVSEKKSQTSCRDFGYDVGTISGEDWSTGKKAFQFREFYRGLLECTDKFPSQHEHMVESALFSELEKTIGAQKQLKQIKPIFYEDVRIHMKTALMASKASHDICEVSDSSGGDIDVFCRRRIGNRSRLTVIEVKDQNESRETFHLAIKQAIAYAVFIRELARSEAGESWMKLWGLGNQPWKKEGFIINAVAAMPKENTTDFSFAGKMLELGKDKIELHYIAFSGVGKPRDGQDVHFETSL